jgi:putative lipoprotein
MKGRPSAALAGVALAALVACRPADDSAVQGASERVLAGTVTYRERMALPPDATIEVRLEDVSRADAPATVLAEQRIAAEGRQVPLPFELRYPANRIEANRSYGVRAQIFAPGGELMFTTATHQAVPQAGATAADSIEIVLRRAQGSVGASGGTIEGELWRLVAILRPGGAEEPVGADPTYTVEFGTDGRYSGRAHCNSFAGSYQRPAPGALTIRAGAATLAACPPPSIADEYLRALASVASYRVGGEELRLAYNSGGELKFVREPRQAAAAPEVGRTFVYDCDGDVSFTVRTGPGEVALWAPASLGGAYQVLSMTRAASGARYEEDETVFWSRGDLATIEFGGRSYVDCRSNPRKAPWADAARRGATFRALGNEPAWYVEVFPERFAIVTELGTNRTELAHGGPIAEGARTTYRAAVGSREATVVIDRRACADSMSGEGFEAAATVLFENRTLVGCGRFL